MSNKNATDVAQQQAAAISAYQTGQLAQATQLALAVLHTVPASPTMHLLLGLIAHKQENYPVAISHLDDALVLAPQDANLHFNLGVILAEHVQYDRAIVHYERAIACDPHCYAAYENLGVLYMLVDRPDQAIATLEAVLVLQPHAFKACCNLGDMLRTMGRYAESAALLERAYALDPNSFALHSHFGKLYYEIGDFPRAVQAFTQALALQPDHSLTAWRLGASQLANGELAAGWRGYDTQSSTNPHRGTLQPLYPAWQGQPLAGKNIVVLPEQGIGDELVFATCFADLIQQAKQVTVYCDQRLLGLFARTYPSARFFPTTRQRGMSPVYIDTEALAETDYMVLLGSLPRYLRPQLNSFPQASPCLLPDPAAQAEWQRWLASLPAGLKIGIAWRSSLRTTERLSSFGSLSAWSSVFALPNVTWINLQVGDCQAELDAAQQQFACDIHQPPGLDLFHDIAGSAALCSQLDWVIAPSVATSMLAGSVGCRNIAFYRRDWLLLGTDRLPWFTSSIPVIPIFNNWPATMQLVADVITKRR